MKEFNERLKTSLLQIDPSGDIDRAIAKLLLDKKRRDTIKYDLMCSLFKQKYSLDFQSFRDEIVQKGVPYEKEQDFFDWDMAITAINDIREEIIYLENLLK